MLARHTRAGADRLDEEFGTAANTPRDGLVPFVDKFHEADSREDDDILSNIVDSSDDDIVST